MTFWILGIIWACCQAVKWWKTWDKLGFLTILVESLWQLRISNFQSTHQWHNLMWNAILASSKYKIYIYSETLLLRISIFSQRHCCWRNLDGNEFFSAVEYISRRLDWEAQAQCGLNITSILISTDFQEKRSIDKKTLLTLQNSPHQHDLEGKEKRTEASPPRLPWCWYWYSFSCSAAARQTAEVYRLGCGWRGRSGNIINLLTCPAP